MAGKPIVFTKTDLATLDGLERVLQQIRLAISDAAEPTPLPPFKDLATSLMPFIREDLQATGRFPLNLQSLLPVTGNGIVLVDTHANRLALFNPNGYDVGQLFFESDRTVTYVVTLSSGVKVWTFHSGVMYVAFSGRPTDLGANDAGFLLEVSDHRHLCRWTATAWVILDNDAGSFIDSAVALGTGYQLCDGTATTYLAVSGATLVQTAFTTPNLTGAATPVYYRRAAAYSGTINAPTAPTISGSSASATTGITIDNESAHTHAITSPTGAPSATTTVDNDGAGSTVAVGSNTHTHTVTSPSGAGSAHAHGVTDAGHTHGVGTYVVSSTAQMRNMDVIPYFRR